MTCKVNADTTNGLKLESDTSGAIDLQTNGTTKVHMDSSGNVGIGTSSPSTNLHISDTGAINRNNLVFSTPNDGTNYNALVGGNLVVDASGTYTTPATNISGSGIEFSSANNLNGHGYIRFLSAPDTNSESSTPVECMRINNKILMIGATSFPAHVPTTNGLRLYLEGGTGSARDCFIINGDGGSGDEPFILFNRNDGTEKCKIFGDGDLVNANNSYGSLSDERFKQDISDSASQWEDIKNVRVRKYKFIDQVNDPNYEAKEQIGVIAQELESSGLSGLVVNHDAKLYEDGEENIPEGKQAGDIRTPERKTVKYSVLYMKAIKALQEAMDRIETLEAKVTALENN